MLKRIVVGAIALAALVALLLLNGWYIKTAAVLVGILAQYEMISALQKGGYKVTGILLLIYAFIIPVIFYFYRYSGIMAVFTGGMILICVIAILFKEYTTEAIVPSIFGMCYPQLLFVSLYAILMVEDPLMSSFLVSVSFGVSICTDSFAYFVGKFLGRKKLCPEISPNKTIAGAIGGVFGGVFGMFLISVIFYSFSFVKWELLLAGAVLSVFSQFGDLTASIIKRRCGIKDFGKILPGHGGILDRIDSVLFIMPLVYGCYLTII